MYLSAYAHLKNKYPGGEVRITEDSVDAYSADGEHCVAIRKNGAGQWTCVSDQLGCRDRFCLAPIPRQARAHKLYASGKVGPAEEHEERAPFAKSIAVNGKVPSMAELVKSGVQFDQSGNLV